MFDTISLFASLLGATVLYLAVCISLVKTGLRGTQNPLQTKSTSVLFACFVFLVASCAALKPISHAATACASVAICIISIAATAVFARQWRKQEAYETARTRRFDKLIDEHRTLEQETRSLPSVCSKTARQHDLTRKEEIVLLYVLQGKTQTEISRELVLSVNTVKSHMRNIYRKMGVHSRRELASAVLEETGINDKQCDRKSEGPYTDQNRQEAGSTKKP